MKNYKISVDISNIFKDISKFNIREYNQPFVYIFISAKNPDDACYKILKDVISKILKKNDHVNTRVFCRLIRHNIRIDKIHLI